MRKQNFETDIIKKLKNLKKKNLETYFPKMKIGKPNKIFEKRNKEERLLLLLFLLVLHMDLLGE